MDVQICSVMTELHVNTHSGKHTDVHVCVCVCVEGEISHVGKARGSGCPLFCSQLLPLERSP